MWGADQARQGTGGCMRGILVAAVCGLVICTTAPTAFAVTYKEFSDEFRKNPEAFKRKYIGKSVTVTGTVGMIALEPARSGPGSGPAIGLTDLDKETVYCYLNGADKERALSIGKGDAVTIAGTFLRANVAGLHVDPCSFQ